MVEASYYPVQYHKYPYDTVQYSTSLVRCVLYCQEKYDRGIRGVLLRLLRLIGLLR